MRTTLLVRKYGPEIHRLHLDWPHSEGYVRTMTNKETFIAATGGFRLESAEQFKARQAEIRRIERRLKSGKYSEQSHRRLCELKDIVFDSYELDEHPNA
ncbi:MAG: hypothetical protein WBW57_10380 [Candidatus Sulfotelmatobacter sp.]